MGTDCQPKRIFRVLLRGPGDCAYSHANGYKPVKARTAREALDAHCSDTLWAPPAPGSRYEYAVLDIGDYSVQTFTVESTAAYTITEL